MGCGASKVGTAVKQPSEPSPANDIESNASLVPSEYGEKLFSVKGRQPTASTEGNRSQVQRKESVVMSENMMREHRFRCQMKRLEKPTVEEWVEEMKQVLPNVLSYPRPSTAGCAASSLVED